MNISLKRNPSTALSTIGRVSLDNVEYCYSLERPEVQIPVGTYSIEIRYSPRFNRPLPHLLEVPGRTDILIHAGNWPRDTEGCILVGLQKGQDSIFQSRVALDPLVLQIQAAIDSGIKVQISVTLVLI